MLEGVFLWTVLICVGGAIAFVAAIDLLFLVLLWRWKVVSKAFYRRQRAKERARNRRLRLDHVTHTVQPTEKKRRPRGGTNIKDTSDTLVMNKREINRPNDNRW